jgi:hypothetical protein
VLHNFTILAPRKKSRAHFFSLFLHHFLGQSPSSFTCQLSKGWNIKIPWLLVPLPITNHTLENSDNKIGGHLHE